ncbi:MAG: ABC transporter ATP-binding protein [Bdellovibrionota bacterium]
MILEINGVNQVFRSGFWMRRVQVLFDVHLKVPEKSIFGFLGANGAGKTTLIHLITGLREPTSGTVRVAGFDAHSREARSKIGYLPERPYFYEHLTGEGLLRYFGTISGMNSSRLQSRIPKVLSVVGMKEARRVELRKYSKGMLQRIGIAQAILHDPEFLVLDEPMSGLDPLGRKEIRELISQLAGEGRTVFFSSHVIPDVEAICDQVALIQKGKLLGCGPIGGFLAEGPLQTEVAFTGITAEKARELGIAAPREIPDGVRATLSGQTEVGSVLLKLLQAKAQVLWVTPIRPSLESYFDHKESQ